MSNRISDVSPQMSYRYALAAIEVVGVDQVIDITGDDFDFVTSSKLWLPVERARVRRCVEAICYGALDYLGFPRFPLPVEFIAAGIAIHVDSRNLLVACQVMGGAEYVDNIVRGVDAPVTPQAILGLVLQIKAGVTSSIDARDQIVKRRVPRAEKESS